jgi:hypothetical protein
MMNRHCSYQRLLLLASFAGCSLLCEAFVVVPLVATRNQVSKIQEGQPIHTSLFLAQQRKRRRRKPSPGEDTSDGSPDGAAAFDLNNKSGELPDFVMDDEEPAPKKASSTNPDEITSAMMGDANSKSVRTINELLSDRSLESKFDFDETEEGSKLPDLAVLPQTVGGVPQSAETNKKKARKAAAIAANKEEEEKEESFLSKIPGIIGITDEKGKISGVKVRYVTSYLLTYLL